MRQTTQDLGVRVALKGAGQFLFQRIDLGGELGQDLDGRSHDVAVGDRDRRWRAQLGAGQRMLDRGGAAGEVASPAGLAQQPRDLGHLQRAAPFGGGCCAQHGQGLRASQVGAQRGQRRGIELRRALPSPLTWRCRAQISPWCARARILIASAWSLSPAMRR
jgi:hypothetical protein